MTNQNNRMVLGGSLAGYVARLCALALVASVAMSAYAQAKPEAKKTAKKTESGETLYHGYTVHQSIELGGRVSSVSGSKPMWATMNNQSTGMRVLDQSLEMRAVNGKGFLVDSLSTSAYGFGGDPYSGARLNASKGKAWDFAGTFRRDRNYFDYNGFANSQDPAPYLQSAYNNGATAIEMIQQNHSMHLYDTVRRNTDVKLTLLPVSKISFALGWNHGTHEGPTLTTVHGTTTTEAYQWFRNSSDTYSLTVSAKLAPRTSVSYDQFVSINKSESTLSLPNSSQPLWNATNVFNYGGYSYQGGMVPVAAAGNQGVASGLMANLGLTVTAVPSTSVVTYAANNSKSTSVTKAGYCGTEQIVNGTTLNAATLQPWMTNGVLSAYCKAATADNLYAPMRLIAPTEQLRFSSSYFKNVTFNGHLAYSGGENDLPALNWTQLGFSNSAPTYGYSTTSKTWSPTVTSATSNTDTVGTVVAGVSGAAGTGFGIVKRSNLNGDLGFVAQLSSKVSFSDNFAYTGFRTSGGVLYQSTGYYISDLGGASPLPSLATNFSSPGVFSVAGAATGTIAPAGGANKGVAGLNYFLAQKLYTNTASVAYRLSPIVKLSAGYRYKQREISYLSYYGYLDTSAMKWNSNGGIFGVAIDPSRKARFNATYELESWGMDSGVSAAAFTRSAPVRSDVVKARTILKPASFLDLSVAMNLKFGSNHDPLVQLKQNNQEYTANAVVRASEKLNFDLSYGYSEYTSHVDTCFQFSGLVGTQTAPWGATNAGTCAAANSSNGGTANLLYDSAYKTPSNYYLADVNFTPAKLVKLNAGFRMNEVHGSTKLLNPIQVPGALDSRNLAPFADVEFKVAQQWSWHGNYNYSGYGETGAQNAVANGVYSYNMNGLPSRNMHGNVLTMGVKYAF